jgi:hypothetical protein
MIVDLRTYTMVPGKLKAFLTLYEAEGLPVQKRYLPQLIGYFVTEIGTLNQVVHLWGYDSLADYEQRSQARDAHPDFPAYLAASEHLIEAQETRLIRSVPLSIR